MTKAKNRRSRKASRAHKPSLPRVIGANDNINTANDNHAVVVRGVVLNKAQAKRLEAAEAKRASPDHDTQVKGRDEMAALEIEIDRAALRLRREAEALETQALEDARGSVADIEVIDHKDKDRGETLKLPRVRIASRDGLETLLTAHSISRIQHAAGLRYRDDYEAIDPERGLTPPALDQTRNIVRGGEGYAQKRREIEERVRDLEAMIQAEDRTFKGALGRSEVQRLGRAVWALRGIAGKGTNLSTLSSSGSVQAMTSDALRQALDCAAIAYGLE